MAMSDKVQTNSVTKTAATAGVLAAAAAAGRMAHAQGSETLKVALLGCGGRGTGAVRQCLDADPGVVVVAVADLFESQATGARRRLEREDKYRDRVKITDDNVFWGYDCHEKIAQVDCDIILMATAPAFRGPQLMAAIKAGKHVFTEKPIATDVAGCRMVIEAADLATEKGLSIVAGTQRRHELSRIELMNRIHDGQIGELLGGQCYWYGGGIWYRGHREGMTEMDWQCWNWYHFTWLSGDQICEQHIHNIDVINWCFGGPPKQILAVGGRGVRDYSNDAKQVAQALNGSTEGWEKYNGDIWDHIYAEFEYENGARCLSFSGHGPGTGRNGESIVGSKGSSDCRISIRGENDWNYEGPMVDGMLQEHVHLIQSIREGKPINEGRQVAESTLTAIGARIAAKTGQNISFNWLLRGANETLVPPMDQIKAGPGHFHPIATGADPLPV